VATSVLIVRVEVEALAPLGVTEAALKLHDESAGRPEQARLTWVSKPPAGVTLMVEVAVLPGLIVPLAGLSETLKSAGTAVTVTLTADDVEAAKLVSPPYAAVMECGPTARLLVE
jgi:hypothetical protein